MKTVNIKRYLGACAAAVTLSVASFGVQAETYPTDMTVDDVSALGSAFGVAAGQRTTVAFDTLVTGSVSASDISGEAPRVAADGARFVVFNSADTAPIVPILVNGTAGVQDTTGLTVDGTNITGGTLRFDAGTPPVGAVQATISVDFDAGTFIIWSGTDSTGGTSSPAYAASGTFPPITPPPPAGTNPFCETDIECIPVMPPFMMVFSGLGLLLLARRHLQY